MEQENSQPPLPPLKNPKYRHVSRSAAKRESVQLLGSIQDLRLQFSQVGVSHKAGAGAGVKSPGGLGSLGEDGEEEADHPKLGVEKGKERKERKPWKEVDLPRVDPEAARQEAQDIIRAIREIWGLSAPLSPTSPNHQALSTSKSLYFDLSIVQGEEPAPRTSDDIHSALVTTARSIRRIRFLALSVSHHNQGQRTLTHGSLLPVPSSKLRPRFSTPSRPSLPLPRAVSGPVNRRSTSSMSRPGDDRLADLRKAALEVLNTLRVLEENLRVGEAELQGPSLDQSIVYSEPDSLDSDYDSDSYNLNVLAQSQEMSLSSQPWEERIASEGREYRVLEGTEWEKVARDTREGVGKWVGVVEKLFVVEGKGENVGQEEGWSKEGWDGRVLERLHAFLLANLSLDLALRLPPPQSSDFATNFLSVLSDGYILIEAYNTSLLKSSKPWGFIPEEDVHATLNSGGSDESGTANPTNEDVKRDKEWTFRRVGNLTCFAAALRHRFQLPIVMPSANTSTFLQPKRPVALPRPEKETKAIRTEQEPSLVACERATSVHRVSLPSAPAGKGKDVPRIDFDPMVIAKKLEGWEEMLEKAVGKWVESVAKEVSDVRSAIQLRQAAARQEDKGGSI
ncbi:hypothetical protein L202_05428 [Cryptococcus amylolentus CBS 6039]|uniref:Uncharacterized protein n=2 Tax=Cryptococcus amylolentus TaxID=104669 RepID=A0A1E3HKF7_9TREE|nr:hypothetical protein L202_05428 [Cryptococcus amylolentus CBS 6039]ODN76832.1 hypothetical protein L202_05428 [Cryptococcus amylolentus CBS 6039]ODO04748.1 hypothetical protein I350_05358 [Cryptococcus amylolentus CBS 6273]